MKRKIQIEIETREVLAVRRFTTATCAKCGERAAMVSVEEASLLAGFGSLATQRPPTGSPIHFAEGSDGVLLVCLNSLLKSI